MYKKHIFSQLEKKNFVDILKKYTIVIESKETDAASLRRKNVAWERITLEYNASTHATCQVQSKQLRRLWMNMKQRQREALKKKREQREAVKSEPSSSAIVDEVPQAVPASPAFIAVGDGANLENLDNETRDRWRRAEELHELQKELIKEKIREARAKADLAELLLQKERAEDEVNYNA